MLISRGRQRLPLLIRGGDAGRTCHASGGVSCRVTRGSSAPFVLLAGLMHLLPPWLTPTLDLSTEPVKQHHGSLHADSDVKMRLKVELTRST